ncbi:604_t:CDS:2, partial [Diversispora eburnea]
CMKLIRIDNVKPTKKFHNARSRYVEIIKPEDLMQKHWNNESCIRSNHSLTINKGLESPSQIII